jgi:Glycosyltransferase family 87
VDDVDGPLGPRSIARREVQPWPPDPRLVEYLIVTTTLIAAKLAFELPLPAAAVPAFAAVHGAVLLRWAGRPAVRVACFGVVLLLIGVVPAASRIGATWAGDDKQAHDGGVLVTDAGIHALLHGQDPYTVSYEPQLADWPISVQGHPHVNPMTSHYPYWPGSLALQVPVQAPLLALGLRVDARYVYLAIYLGIGLGLAAWSLRTRGDVLLALPVCVDPVLMHSLWWGANEVLLVAGLAAGAWALATRRPVAAGLLLGATLAVKQTLAPMVALFAVWLWAEARAGRLARRMAWWASGVTVGVPIVTGLPFLLWHGGALVDDAVAYPSGLGPRPFPITGWSLPGLLLRSGTLHDAFLPLPLWVALPAATLSVVTLLACAWWVIRQPSPRTLMLASGIAVLAPLLLHRWLYLSYLASPITALTLGLLVRWPAAPTASPARPAHLVGVEAAVSP